MLRDAVRLDAVVSVEAYTSLASALVELGKDVESSAVLDDGVAAFRLADAASEGAGASSARVETSPWAARGASFFLTADDTAERCGALI